MSREIKFRAWDADSGKMFQPDGIFNGKPFLEGPPEGSVTVYDCPIMQYTGLKDSDSVEIYEGDIVEFTYWWFDGNVAESTLTGEVVYLPDCMSYGLKGVKNKEWIRHIGGKEGDTDVAAFAVWLFDEADFRVIGNIHQNPELLK